MNIRILTSYDMTNNWNISELNDVIIIYIK